MIWSDIDIRSALRRGEIAVSPEPDLDGPALQPASLELTLGEAVYVKENQFVLAHTREVVTLGPTVAAQLSGKSSLARLGLLVHATAGWIDPGFSGQIVLELKNIGESVEFDLYAGKPIAQLIFHQLKTPALRAYGHRHLGSHYQNQRGTRRSYLETDT